MIVRLVHGEERAAALAWLAAHDPEAAPRSLAATADVVIAHAETIAALAIVHQPLRRLELLAHADLAALPALLAQLRANGVASALLWGGPHNEVHHAALAAAGFVQTGESIVVRRTLAALPAVREPWQLRSEAEIGTAALRTAVIAAEPPVAGDPLEALCRAAPPAFRARWWWRADLAAEPVGVVLPQPHGVDGVSMAFIGLLPAWRGRKLSADLLGAALARFAAAGARWYIDEAAHDNVAAQRMLISIGCTPVARRYTFAA